MKLRTKHNIIFSETLKYFQTFNVGNMENPGPSVLKESPTLQLPGETPSEEDFKDTKPYLFFPKYRQMDEMGSHDMNAEIKGRVVFLLERERLGQYGFFSSNCLCCSYLSLSHKITALQAIMMERLFHVVSVHLIRCWWSRPRRSALIIKLKNQMDEEDAPASHSPAGAHSDFMEWSGLEGTLKTT